MIHRRHALALVAAAALGAGVFAAAVLDAPGHPGVLFAETGYEVVARVDGEVLRAVAGLGDAVDEGDLLVELEAAALRRAAAVADAEVSAARAARDQARARRQLAEESHERRRSQPEVFAKEEIRAAELEALAAEAALEAAEARVAAESARRARARERLAAARVVAPAAGTVAALYVEEAGFVREGAPVARIVSGLGLYVRFALPPEAAANLAPGDEVEVLLDESRAAVLAATVTRVAPEVDRPSGLVFAEAGVTRPPGDAPPGPLSGRAVRVRLSERRGKSGEPLADDRERP